MIRRVSALIGIAVLLAMLASLIWAVHRHRRNTHMVDDPDELSPVIANTVPPYWRLQVTSFATALSS